MMADRIRNWFLHLSPERHERLLQELLDLDKKRRVDYREGLAKKIESDMIWMMNQLGELIEKENPLFKGRMMQCGSSYNQTKAVGRVLLVTTLRGENLNYKVVAMEEFQASYSIMGFLMSSAMMFGHVHFVNGSIQFYGLQPYLIGQPDEMDFAFQWDLSETRSEKIVHIQFYSQGLKHIERLNEANVSPEPGLIPIDEVYLTFSINDFYDKFQPDYVTNDIEPRTIHIRFYKTVNDALMKMKLLPDWEHGGFASPDCTGTRANGPALMMQFNYNLENGAKLALTVDLVLAIDLKEIYDGDLEEVCALHIGSTWQQELLKKNHFLDKILTKIHHSVLLDSTFAERIWLSAMDIEHPVKIAVRIFKILNQMALQHPDTDMKIDSSLYSVDEKHMRVLKSLRRRMENYATAEDKEDSRKLAMYRLCQRPVKQLQYFDMKVPEGERFVDLGECLGNRPYLKSHVFQSVVLALYALRCTQYPDIAEDQIWSKEDIPKIVVNVMMIIQRFLDGCVDEDPSRNRSRLWTFPQLYLESEGHRYRLHQPESLCLDVYRGETVKQHFARMWHLFQQFTSVGADSENLCDLQSDAIGQDEATPPARTDEKVVHLLSVNCFKENPDD